MLIVNARLLWFVAEDVDMMSLFDDLLSAILVTIARKLRFDGATALLGNGGHLNLCKHTSANAKRMRGGTASERMNNKPKSSHLLTSGEFALLKGALDVAELSAGDNVFVGLLNRTVLPRGAFFELAHRLRRDCKCDLLSIFVPRTLFRQTPTKAA